MNAPIQYFKDSVLTGRPAIEVLALRLPNLVGAMRKTKADAYHTDDDYANFLSRELEATAVKVLEAPLSGLPLSEGAVIPINSSIPEGADSFTYVVENGTGQAQWEDDYASGSLPMVEQNAKEFLKPIREFGIAWQISLHEMRASSFAGRGDLGQKKARTAMRAMNEFQEFVGLYGDASRDMQGFCNHPNVPIIAPTYDANVSSSDWDVKSGELIQADIVAMKQLMLDTTNGALEISRMQIPARIWASLDRPYIVDSAGTTVAMSNMSIRQFIVQANPEIDFGTMLRLQENKSQAPSLTPDNPTKKQLDADRVVAYANSPDVVELVRPIPPRFQPGQWYELRMKHPGYSTTGGTVYWQPNGAVYMDVKEAA